MSNGYPANNVYIGARYVPKLVGEWDSTKETAYEPLIIVTYQGDSYTSRQYVPAGIDISNTEYWVLTGNFNGQIESFRLALEAVGNRANTIYMDTVQDMMESTRLKAGDIVTCFGYYQLGDMPITSYSIIEDGAADGGSIISVGNTLKARALFGHTITPSQFGCTPDDTANMLTYVNFVNNNNYEFEVDGLYKIAEPLTIAKSMRGYPNNQGRCGFIWDGEAADSSLITLSDTLSSGYPDTFVSDLYIQCNNDDQPTTSGLSYGVAIPNASKVTLARLRINHASKFALKLTSAWNLTIEAVNSFGNGGLLTTLGGIVTSSYFNRLYCQGCKAANAMILENVHYSSFSDLAFDSCNTSSDLISLSACDGVILSGIGSEGSSPQSFFNLSSCKATKIDGINLISCDLNLAILYASGNTFAEFTSPRCDKCTKKGNGYRSYFADSMNGFVTIKSGSSPEEAGGDAVFTSTGSVLIINPNKISMYINGTEKTIVS